MISKQSQTSAVVVLLSGTSKLLPLSKSSTIYVSTTDTYYNVATINYNNNSHSIVVKFTNGHWSECDAQEVLQLLDCVSVEDFKNYQFTF